MGDRLGCMECGFGRGAVRRDAGIAGDDFMLKEAVDKKSLENIRILYEASFPESEKKPFSFMLQKREEGFFDFLAIENDRGGFCGLAIMLLSGEFALLDYLAIAPESRGSGIGSSILKELRERYREERIVVEIESTVGAGADAAANVPERLRRKAFYLRNAMVPMNFRVELMGVEMELLTFGRNLTFEEYFGIYDRVLPGNTQEKVKPVG